MNPGVGGTLLEALAAVLAGNGVYFLLLLPRLPAPWRHQPFAADRGLALDFLLCLAAFAAIRLGRGWFDWRRGRQ